MSDKPNWVPSTVTAKAVADAGFDYDPEQGIIKSRIDAIQRRFGYCWKYDQAAPVLSMIIDCEPICFTYDGAKWMIELWKGQYGIMTGAEIGVYKKSAESFVSLGLNYLRNRDTYEAGKSLVSAGVDHLANWYACADIADYQKLKLSFTLKKDSKDFFRRGPESHWWLTGFKWGVYTEKTSDLTLVVTIEFLNEPKMQKAFTGALSNLGYHPTTLGQKVTFNFEKPWTPQPGSRSTLESIMQKNNKARVADYDALKAKLGLKDDNPNGFDIQGAAGQAKDVFEQFTKKIWRH